MIDRIKTSQGRAVHAALRELESLFAPECRLTFVARVPTVPGSEMIVSNDDLRGLADTLDAAARRL